MVHKLMSTYHTVLGRSQRLDSDALELTACPKDFTWPVLAVSQPGQVVMMVFRI